MDWAQLLPSLLKPQRPLAAAGRRSARLIWAATLVHTLQSENVAPPCIESKSAKLEVEANKMQPALPRASCWDENSYDSSSRSLPDFVNPFAAHRPPSSRLTGAHADGLPRGVQALVNMVRQHIHEPCHAMLSLVQCHGTLAPRHKWACDQHSLQVMNRQNCRASACQGRQADEAGQVRPSCHAIRSFGHVIKAPWMHLCRLPMSVVP